jgi:hypothetical protein
VKVRLVTSLLAASLAVGAGCGGGDDRLSRDEFIEQADANCAKAEKDLLAVGDLPQNAEDIDEYAERIRPIVENAWNEQKALKPPEDLQDEYDEWIATGEDALDFIDEVREAGAAEDTQRVADLFQQAEARVRETEQLSRAMGLRDCGVEGRRE